MNSNIMAIYKTWRKNEINWIHMVDIHTREVLETPEVIFALQALRQLLKWREPPHLTMINEEV